MTLWKIGLQVLSSPRMWGCFRTVLRSFNAVSVFPTHVGVFPFRATLELLLDRSSPRMWGCFQLPGLPKLLDAVFPTHVGVFLQVLFSSFYSYCLPHACGGVSREKPEPDPHPASSPRMWGCFRFQRKPQNRQGVFPTHVGVFPMGGVVSGLFGGLPHACGGVSTP